MEAHRAIVYVSAATVPTTDIELEALLLEAREHNRNTGITGVLLFSDDSFMQCFEGPATAVESTWQRIRNSRRHKSIIELANEGVEQRSFQDWQMGCAHLTASSLVGLSTANWTRRLGRDGHGDESSGLQLLKKFWSTSQRMWD